MAKIGLTYGQLKSLSPCEDAFKRVTMLLGGARKWSGKKIDAARARKAGVTFDDILWAASAVASKDKDVERRLRLWLADCAARVLHIYERHQGDDRPRKAIVAARRFARGEIGDAAWDAARDAAWDAASVVAWAAAWDAARVVAWAAARDAAGAAAWAAARDAARDAERAWQFDRLIARLSEKDPDDYPLPERSREFA